MNIKEEIKKRTEQEIERVIRRAQKIAERELILANRKKQQELTKQKEGIKNLIRAKKERLESELELEFKLKELQIKDELIEEVFREVKEELRNLSEAEIMLSLKKLISEGVENLNSKEIIVYVNKRFKEALAKHLEFFKKEAVDIKDVREREMLGGVIVLLKEKRRFFNNSFEERFNRLKEDLKIQIAEILKNG